MHTVKSSKSHLTKRPVLMIATPKNDQMCFGNAMQGKISTIAYQMPLKKAYQMYPIKN